MYQNHEWPDFSKLPRSSAIGAVELLPIAVIAVLIPTIQASTVTNGPAIWVLGAMLAVGAIGLLLLAFRRQQKNIEAFRLFAAKHEAIYHRELEPKNIQGAIYNLGHSSTINNQFIWNMNGKKLSVYRYDYVVGHGKNKSHKKWHENPLTFTFLRFRENASHSMNFSNV